MCQSACMELQSWEISVFPTSVCFCRGVAGPFENSFSLQKGLNKMTTLCLLLCITYQNANSW